MEKNIKLNSFSIVENISGNIFKLLDKNSKNFFGFEEIYISSIKKNSIKAWKKHTLMTCNLYVIKGEVKFVFLSQDESFSEIILNENERKFITVYPNTIFGFKGLSFEDSKILNISNLIHNPNESINIDLNKYRYDW